VPDVGRAASGDYIKDEGKAGRMGARLMAIVAEGDRGRVYLAPTPEMEAVALTASRVEAGGRDAQEPARLLHAELRLTTWGDLFTPRQLVALTTFSDLVQEARERVRRDALAAGLPDDNKPLRDGGTGATAYAEAVGCIWRSCGRKAADYWSTQSARGTQAGNHPVIRLDGKRSR
jgi:putative DNA methylase